MNTFFRTTAFVAVLLATASLHAADVEMKTVTIDEFFAGQLQPIPLKLKIPKNYVHAKDLEVDETYTYWMQPQEIKPAADSGDLPAKTGYVWGKISQDVGYLKEQKKFSQEDELKAKLAEAGNEIVAQKKRDVGGFAVISTTVGMKQEKGPRRLIFTAYIATNIETNCIFISYSQPSGFSEEQATKVWDTIIDSVSKT